MDRSLPDTLANANLQCPINTPSSFHPVEYRHIEGLVSEETLFFAYYCRINNSARKAEEIIETIIDY